MSHQLEARLAAAERRLAPPNPLVIVVYGGLSGGDPTCANVEGADFEREAESFPACQKVVAAATAARAQCIVIGGLPPEPRFRRCRV
jgi:hypothetical protein